MKKTIFALLCAALLLSACGSPPASAQASAGPAPASVSAGPESRSVPESGGSQSAPSPSSASPGEDGGLFAVAQPYGTYSVPSGWYEVEEFSGDGLAFYLKNGTPLDTPTSNITVSEGTNQYGEEDFQAFAQAIDQQLKSQVTPDVTNYHGGGAYTEKGYPLITMVIETEQTITTQYYIVGDYRFVMVHATDFRDESIPDTEETALAIVHSFEWAE